MDIPQLFEQAEAYADSFQYNEARDCYLQILRVESQNLKAIEDCAGIMLELGEVESCKKLLNQCIELAPDIGHAKYLTLAQLEEGQRSLQYYLQGLETLNKASSPDSKFQREISNVHISIAELYTTDLCDESDAEEQCLKHLQLAQMSDTQNPEVYRSTASYYLIKGDKELAKENITKSLNLWLPHYEAVRTNNSIAVGDPVELCPLSIEARIDCVKVLIETEMWDEAKQVCDGLLEEEEDNIEVWYLLGWSNYLIGSDYYGNARFYFNKVIELHRKLKTSDEDLVEHAMSLLETMGPENEHDKENEDDGEWESLESSSDDEMNSQ